MIEFDIRKCGKYGHIIVHVNDVTVELGHLSKSELQSILSEIKDVQEDLEWLIENTNDS